MIAVLTALSTALVAPAPALRFAPAVVAPRAARFAPVRNVAAAAPAAAAAKQTGADAWTASLDYPAFREEVHALGQSLADGQGEADIRHLKKMIAWSNTCGAVGMLTMWMSNPIGRLISILGLSTWTCTRWTMVGHHICHGGYNRQDDVKQGGTGRFTSTGFALGSVWRRARDWFDWMLPEAWNVEHNNLHHYRLGESGDPDLVERNMVILRNIKLPRALKYAAVAGIAAMWKWFYYAPNTYKQLKLQQMRKEGIAVTEEEAHAPFTLPLALFVWSEGKRFNTGPVDFVKNVMGPYFLLRFFALPLPLALINPALYWVAVSNLALADMASNLHSFIIIATNHCGNDMYKFANSCVPRSGTFYMRAVTSSSNFRTGNGVGGKVHGFRADLNDFLHGWLNFQIEHHAWPQLSMLSYQKSAPLMRAICEKHGVPYVQENVFIRLKKLADVMVGAADMRPFPAEWEYEPDRFTWVDQRK